MARLSKEKRDKLILVTIATVALTAGLGLGVIKTRKEQLGRSQSQIDQAREKLEKAKKMVSRAAQAQAEIEAATRKLKAIQETMAPGADLYTWAYQLLGNAGGGHDVNVIEVTRPVKGDVGLLAQFPFDAALFSVRGSAYFHDFGKFLADFENELPYFRVQNISLTAGSEGAVGTEEKLFFKMDVVALIKPNP